MDEAKPDMKPQSAKSKRDILDEVMIETKAPSARSNKSHDSKAWSSDSGDVDMDFGFKTKSIYCVLEFYRSYVLL